MPKKKAAAKKAKPAATPAPKDNLADRAVAFRDGLDSNDEQLLHQMVGRLCRDPNGTASVIVQLAVCCAAQDYSPDDVKAALEALDAE